MIILTPVTREELVSYIPSGKIAAEIGVWNGMFSKDIVTRNKPKLLHMIDPWGGKDDQYVMEYKIQADMEQKYNAVLGIFKEYLKSESVKIHRKYSTDWAKTVGDGELDWIYVDGMHTYDAVKSDLAAVDRIVSEDGLIIGHDFSRRKNFGVIRAAQEFVESRNYKIIVITIEDAPTYVIAKNEKSEFVCEFLDNLVRAEPRIIKIPMSFIDGYDQTVNNIDNKTYRFTMEFGVR